METQQCAQLTGTNRSFDLIVLIIKEHASQRADDENPSAGARDRIGKTSKTIGKNRFCFLQTTDVRGQATEVYSSVFRSPFSVFLVPPFAGLVALEAHTDPSELGREILSANGTVSKTGRVKAIRPDPIPNSAVKRLSANGTLSQDTGE